MSENAAQIRDSASPATTLAAPAVRVPEGQDLCGFPRAKSYMVPAPSYALERRRELARKKAVRAALDYFKANMPGRFKGRAWAIDRIQRHRTPLREAKRLVVCLRKKGIADTLDDGALDHSDVQELRARLIRRHGFLDLPQAALLDRMERMIAADEMTRERFETMAADVLAMKAAITPEVRARMVGSRGVAPHVPC